MIDEKDETYGYNLVGFACGFATTFIFLKHAKRGKIFVRRKRSKKNRRYIRLSRLYHKRMKECDGIQFCYACWDLGTLKFWRIHNIYVNFVLKRFKRRVLPWRLIRRKK